MATSMMPHNEDPIERAVKEVWLEHPDGIGIKILMEKLEARLPSDTVITKKRVKVAKNAIPYRQLMTATGPQLSKEKTDFVQQKIQERQSLRHERRFDEADRICRGLEGMGIELDDALKTWTAVERAQPETNVENGETNSAKSSDDGVPCGMCGRFFASRNLVFKHLRDPSSGCGNNIFASGQSLPDAPSNVAKKERKDKAFRGRSDKKDRSHLQRIDKSACLWFGDLPVPWTRFGAKHKRIRALLRQYLPRNVPQPFILKVIRKSYRDYQNDRAYLGFAIVVFRDADEAEIVRKEMNEILVEAAVVFKDEILNPKEADALLELPSFELKVRLDVAEKDNGNSTPKSSTATRQPGLDPPLIEQLRPLSTRLLQERTHRWKTASDTTEKNTESQVSDSDTDEQLSEFKMHEKCLDQLVQCYKSKDPRKFVRRQGRPIPELIRARLLAILSSLRWPAQNDRPALVSERYLVLRDNVTSQRYFADLSDACAELMKWTDPEFTYSAIAVTKNFVSSPHIDERDQSFQYAVSLGDFDQGGELCVEGRSIEENTGEILEEVVNVVDTRNRIARVDGRHIHWVRTWEGGDRFSLIYYDTREQNATPVMQIGVDEEFLNNNDY